MPDPAALNAALTLFGEAPAGQRLGRSQQLILQAVERAGQDGLTTDEAGALVHEQRGHHDQGQRCKFCASDGRQVLVSLRRHGLVVRRRSGGWTLTGGRASDPALLAKDIPF